MEKSTQTHQPKPKVKQFIVIAVYALNGHFEEEFGVSAIDRGMWGLWPCVSESIEERENLREMSEVPKRKREGDSV